MKYYAFLESLSVGDYMELIQQGLEWIKFGEIVSKDTRIFIKPNLTFPIYRPGVMTNPQAIEAAILAIREYTPNIFIGDADSGGYNRFSMDEVYKETDIWQFTERYVMQLVNLSRVERRTIFFQCSGRRFSLELPRLLTDEIDLLISMPVPKMHTNMVVSLAFKNQWGCISEPRDRLRLHPYLKHVLLEVNKTVKAKVVIMDGRYGLNMNSPIRGHPVELNWILVTNDLGAADRLACELM